MTLPLLQEQGAAGGLVQGLGLGLQQAMPSIYEMISSRQKQKQINQILGIGESPQKPQLSLQPTAQGDQNASSPEQMPSSPLQQLTPEKIFAMQQVDPQLAGTLATIYTGQEKERASQREREFLPEKEYIQHAAKENIDYLNEVSRIENDMPSTEFSLSMVEDSLGNADKWAASRDKLAELTGFAGFKSAAGTELDSAIKNYFLGDLSSIKGGRANIFLEKQIRDAYPKAGQDPISNQKILLGMRLKEKISRLKVDKTRELENKFIEKQNFLPSGFKAMVNKAMQPEVAKIEKDAIQTLHNMSKLEESRDKIFRAYLKPGEVLMMDSTGNPFAVKKSEVPAYREQGYIPMGEK